MAEKDKKEELSVEVTPEVIPTEFAKTEEVLPIEDSMPQPTSIKELDIELPEWENMTDVAIKQFLILNPQVPNNIKIRGFTTEQWKKASDFGMTPEQLKKYAGKI